jgi:hypothetical protein
MKQCPFGINCNDCKFFSTWRLVSDKGEEKFEECCGFEVLFSEIPKIRGSIDGCQSSANETRNRSIETKNIVNGFITGLVGMATQKVIGK